MVGCVWPRLRAAAPSVPARAIARKILRSLHSTRHPNRTEWTLCSITDVHAGGNARWLEMTCEERASVMNKTMKAAILETYGKPFHISDIPVPTPGSREVLVRIAASCVNPLDTKIHTGAAEHARHPLPAILGIDLAGTVEAVGSEVPDFRRGDEVYAMAGGVGGLQGTLAEYAAVDADLLAVKPANLSMREAAALPLVVITAWEGLVDRAQVR